MTSRARDASLAKQSLIRTLYFVTAGQFVFILGLILFMAYAFANLKVYVPPGFSDGGELTINEVPDVYAYQFASTLWRKINFWKENGEVDYLKSLTTYKNYITPECRSQLQAKYYSLKNDNELKDRTRTLRISSNHPYRATDVRSSAPGVWDIDFTGVLQETVKSLPIKDSVIHFPLRVVYFNVDMDLNPWGLAIDCYYDSPKLIKDNLREAKS